MQKIPAHFTKYKLGKEFLSIFTTLTSNIYYFFMHSEWINTLQIYWSIKYVTDFFFLLPNFILLRESQLKFLATFSRKFSQTSIMDLYSNTQHNYLVSLLHYVYIYAQFLLFTCNEIAFLLNCNIKYCKITFLGIT